eukprot:TRINITY_DN75805_c0_g1_i1.p1 TRINITY_DN75805_c0_g1~~TRINITY_DN75805_c0_g1_i1.p1  ORF type:complete len:157 (-),score=18.44 TRINITY_DN75805_c0_g1_i1:96-566(-)
MSFHYYGSPGPIGASVNPGPIANPHLRGSEPPAFDFGNEPSGNFQRLSMTRLQRCQEAAHHAHADNMLRQQHRAMTGSIYGHNQDLHPTLRAGASRRSLSSPLVAAGTNAAAPMMNTRVGPGPMSSHGSANRTPDMSARSGCSVGYGYDRDGQNML